MASLALRNKSYRLTFCYRGKRYTFTIGEVTQREAENWSAAVDQTLMRMNQGYLRLPSGADLVEFVKGGGKAEEPPQERPERVTLRAFIDRYLVTHRAGMEENSLATVRMHLNHFVDSLGDRFEVRQLALSDLQEHVDRRRKEKKSLSPATLKKEVASLRAAWNWGLNMGLVSVPFPSRGVVYPKDDEKPPFQTRAEIERQVLGGLTEAEIAELWESVYLTQPEIAELLEHVKANAGHGWIYPAVCFAAHTGARRSEVLRVRVHDVHLAGETVVIHEKKRAKGRRTTRRVPLSPFLVGVLRDWLSRHPGGPYLFCHAAEVFRSKKRSKTTGHRDEKVRPTSLKGRMATVRQRKQSAQGALTRDEAHDHFRRTIAGSKWDVLRGWHVLRHSFISLCASKGTDQRLIDEWVGHTTEDMRKRYRHLFPSTQREAIRSVFA
jgi:integrase